jgi:hypothetical protein
MFEFARKNFFEAGDESSRNGAFFNKKFSVSND